MPSGSAAALNVGADGRPSHARALPRDDRPPRSTRTRASVYPRCSASHGVQRATWWRNVHRDRDDLPRVLAEFDHLGVYEVDDDFVAPPVPDDVTGHHFRRTPRPGQGVLTGNPTIGLSLVLISPKDRARRAGPAGLGRLRAHPPHRRGGRARLHDDHAVRERRRPRPAVPALLRDGHRRPGSLVPVDDAARRGAHRRPALATR